MESQPDLIVYSGFTKLGQVNSLILSVLKILPKVVTLSSYVPDI
jgi:hypothetical protein